MVIFTAIAITTFVMLSPIIALNWSLNARKNKWQMVCVGLLAGMALVSCGRPVITNPIPKPVSDQPIYEGPLDGDYVSKPYMMQTYNEVKNCMGLDEVEVPMPFLLVYPGESVWCHGEAKPDCISNGKIKLPIKTDDRVIRASFVRYFLSLTVMVSENTDYFSRCAEGLYIEGDVE